MFGFGSKSKASKLRKKYEELLSESHRLSTVDRKKSDLKAAEADAVLRELDALESEAGSGS